MERRRHEPTREYNERLNLGKGSAFAKSRLGRLPTTDEVWEADVQPISVWGGMHGIKANCGWAW